MGFYIAAYGKPQFPRDSGILQLENVGCNGSQIAWCALLFAGYALGDWPESRRVRRAWLATWEPDSGHYRIDTRPAIQAAVAADHDGLGSTWVTLDGTCPRYSATRGIKQTPPTCPVLVPLAALWLQCQDGASGRMQHVQVKQLLAAYDLVCENLRTSGWASKLLRLRGPIAAAATTPDAYLSLG